jgi:hypothetical protein
LPRTKKRINNLELSDRLTFKNHKGEEYHMTRGEFRNAAAGLQHKDHRPNLYDTAVEKATPKERLFNLVEINEKSV